MQWAIDNINRLRVGLLLVALTLIVGNLAIGPNPLEMRTVDVLVLAVVVPFLYFGMRWMLNLAIWAQGLRPRIIQVAALFFYFYGLAAVVGLVVQIAGVGQQTPFAMAVIGPAVLAYSAANTIRIAQNDTRHQREPSQQAVRGNRRQRL